MNHKCSLQLHTRHHTFLLTRTSWFNDNNTSHLHLYPYHPHPRLILTHPSKQGHHTTTYYLGTPATTHSMIWIPRTTTFLPTTDNTTILHQPTATQNQHLLLLVATHLILTTPNLNDITWTPRRDLTTCSNILRLVLTILRLQQSHTL